MSDQVTLSCAECGHRFRCTREQWAAGLNCMACNAAIPGPDTSAGDKRKGHKTMLKIKAPAPRPAATHVDMGEASDGQEEAPPPSKKRRPPKSKKKKPRTQGSKAAKRAPGAIESEPRKAAQLKIKIPTAEPVAEPEPDEVEAEDEEIKTAPPAELKVSLPGASGDPNAPVSPGLKIKAAAPVGEPPKVKMATPVGEQPVKQATPVGEQPAVKKATPVGQRPPVKTAQPVGDRPVKTAAAVPVAGRAGDVEERSPIAKATPVEPKQKLNETDPSQLPYSTVKAKTIKGAPLTGAPPKTRQTAEYVDTDTDPAARTMQMAAIKAGMAEPPTETDSDTSTRSGSTRSRTVARAVHRDEAGRPTDRAAAAGFKTGQYSVLRAKPIGKAGDTESGETDEVALLRAKLEAVTDQYAKAEAERARLERLAKADTGTVADELNDQVAELTVKLQRTEADRAKLLRENENAQRSISEHKAASSEQFELQEQLDDLRAKAEAQESQLRELNEEKVKFQKVTVAAKRKIAEGEAENQLLKKQVDKLQEEILSLTEVNLKMNMKLKEGELQHGAEADEVKAELKKVEVKEKLLHDKLKEHVKERMVLNKQIEELTNAKASLEADRDSLNEQAEAAKQVPALKQNLKEVITRRKLLEEKLQKLVPQLKVLSAKTKEQNLEVENLKSELAAGQEQRDGLEGQIKERDELLQEHAIKNEVLVDTLAKLQDQQDSDVAALQQSEAIIGTLEDEVQSLKGKLDELGTAAPEDSEKLAVLESDNQVLKDEIVALTVKLEEAGTSTAEVTALKEERDGLQKQLDEAKAADDERGKANAKELEALNRDKKRLSEQVAQLEEAVKATGEGDGEAKVQEQCVRLQARVTELEETVDKQRDEAQTLTSDNEKQAQRITELETASEAATANDDKLKKLETDCEELRAEKDVLIQKIAEQEAAEPATDPAELTALKTKLETIEGEAQARTKERDEAVADRERLQVENEILHEKLTGMAADSPVEGSDELERLKIENAMLMEKVHEALLDAEQGTPAAGDGAGPSDPKLRAENIALKKKLIEVTKRMKQMQAAGATAAAEPATETPKQEDAQPAKAEKGRRKKRRKGKEAAPEESPEERLARENEQLKQQLEDLKGGKKGRKMRKLWAAELDSVAEELKQAKYLNVVNHQELAHLREEFQQLVPDKQDDANGQAIEAPIVEPQFPEDIIGIIDSVNDEPLIFATSTNQRVDTGKWLRGGACHVALTTEKLFVVAGGKKPFIQAVERGKLGDSFWNAVTGQLVLSPSTADAAISAITMPVESAESLVNLLTASAIEAVEPTAAPEPPSAPVESKQPAEKAG